MHIEVDRAWRVRATCDVALPLSAVAVWGQMRDFARFCAMDPLHRRVVMRSRDGSPAPFPPRGAVLRISHRLLGVGPDRVGRVLTWREGRGYAFSDLSRRGRSAGFPHICSYALRPVDAHRCTLRIGARGIWTARFIPRIVIRFWIWFVLRETARAIEREMKALRRLKRNRAGEAVITRA